MHAMKTTSHTYQQHPSKLSYAVYNSTHSNDTEVDQHEVFGAEPS